MFKNLCCWLFMVTVVTSGCYKQVPLKTTTEVATEIPVVVIPEITVVTKPIVPIEGTIEKQEEPEVVEVPVNEEDLDLARKFVRWKKRYDNSVWWECGKMHAPEDLDAVALEWASAINAAYNDTTYTLRSGKVVKVNKEEAVGIMLNESHFDRCAVGPNPRKFAYANKLLTRPRRSISHSLEELEMVFKNPKFIGRLADIGPGQIVFRIEKGRKHIKWDEALLYLSVNPGVDKVFKEMAARGEMYSTRTPSGYWPGNPEHKLYTLKILRKSSFIFNDALYKKKRKRKKKD